MKKLLLIFFAIFLFSCSDAPVVSPQPLKQFRVETYYKVIKGIKEKSEQETSYHYKYDWLNGKFRQQPNIHSETKYYAIFTDGTYDEISMSQSITLSVGDSIQKNRNVIVEPVK
jgi:hypothetical protein